MNKSFIHTFGFSGTGGSFTSRDILDTDFLGGRAGTSPAAGVSAPFTAKSVGVPPDDRVGRGGGTGEVLSEGLEIMILLRLGGRAGDVSPLKLNVEREC